VFLQVADGDSVADHRTENALGTHWQIDHPASSGIIVSAVEYSPKGSRETVTHLSIRVLGPLQVSLDGEPASGFASDKVRALLVYLALSPDRPHRREALGGLLWPEYPERSARTNLRNALSNLRQVVRDGAASAPFLLRAHQTMQFNGQSDFWLDSVAFEGLVATAPPVSEGLEQAVGLVRGVFLEGFSLADAVPFEEWLLLRREQFCRQTVKALDNLAAIYEECGSFEQALAHARRRVDLEPWEEDGQRLLMRLLVRSGHRAEAVVQYETHRRVLAEELGLEPAPETTRLYEQIRSGELELPTEPPAPVQLVPAQRPPYFLQQEGEAAAPPVFVAREPQMARLDAFLEEALAGHGQVVFVTGGPGRGKTALLAEFGRRAMDAHSDLLVASGNCNAYSGVGDPYLPFRDILGLLTGEVDARWSAGSIGRDHARRLWEALPLAVEALVDHGPHLIPALLPGTALLSRVRAALPSGAPWLHRLTDRLVRQPVPSDALEQNHLFQEVTNLLRALAESHPLVLILDDLQWADTASTSLLFHVGRRLEGARILIAGAYRPVEVALGRGGERHPLDKVLSEFKRTYGDIWLDLAEVEESERRRFVEALLQSEPNDLGKGFRRMLAEYTGGHPLFTIELLRAMQARGDLIRNRAGRWIAGRVLDWNTLPARVEGVIEERVGRLNPELREILSVASVEGEAFTVQVVAQVLGMNEDLLLRWLAQQLGRRHRLVLEQAETQVGPKRIYHFKFTHVLVQNYLYQQLSLGERRLLHGKVAAALESCYGEQVDEFAVQLAHHHDRAGNDDYALYYFTRAAENARRVYANDEAYTHYTRAIEIAERVSLDAASLAKLHRGRGLACETLGRFDAARADHEDILRIACAADERHAEWRATLDLGRLWASRDYDLAGDYFERTLQLARRMDDPALLARSLNWMGNWHANAEDPRKAITYHQAALEIVERLGDRRDLANTLDLLGLAHLLGGDLTASVRTYDRAIALARELDDRARLVTGLIARAVTVSELVLLASVPAITPPDALRDLEKAIRIAREIDSASDEAWAHWALGLLHIVQGRYGQALEVAQRGLDIATRIGHREWIVGNRCALGGLYLELLLPEEARRQFELALTLAEELRSQYWIHHSTGALAAAYCLLDDRTQTHMLLESVISTETPMNSLAKRYCWAKRAELALVEGDLALALDIVERLTASAPGMSTGRVITFFWQLKGETLAAMGQMEEAHTLLEAAVQNARATGERFLLWRIHGILGRRLRALGRQSEAEREFGTAQGLVEKLADTVPTGKLRDDFLQRAQERLRSSP
jgi:adenylate cyclase